MQVLEPFFQDVRHSLRTLRKSPGFTMVAVLTLALGIGANTAIFSVVEGVVLAPLPFRQPDRLVAVYENNLTLKHLIDGSYPDFLDWQRNARSFQQMAAVSFAGFDLSSPGPPEHVNGKEVSSGFFSTLGVKLRLGRDFLPEEDKYGGAPGVIISDRLWRNRFARSPDVLSKSMTLDGVDHTIVGVLAPGFHFAGPDADVYTPLGQGDPLIYSDRTVHPILCISRLRPGVSMAQAQGEMTSVQEALDGLYPTADRGLGAAARSTSPASARRSMRRTAPEWVRLQHLAQPVDGGVAGEVVERRQRRRGRIGPSAARPHRDRDLAGHGERHRTQYVRGSGAVPRSRQVVSQRQRHERVVGVDRDALAGAAEAWRSPPVPEPASTVIRPLAVVPSKAPSPRSTKLPARPSRTPAASR